MVIIIEFILIFIWQVCDEPHPMLIKQLIDHCSKGELSAAHKILRHLWTLGYSAEDIITITFRVIKNHPMEEYLKLGFIKVNYYSLSAFL